GSASPREADFMSNQAHGRLLPAQDPETARLWSGISVYATEQQARNKALDYPFLGNFVARVNIPEDAPIRVERTTHSRGHHTLWGDPTYLLNCVEDVVAV